MMKDKSEWNREGVRVAGEQLALLPPVAALLDPAPRVILCARRLTGKRERERRKPEVPSPNPDLDGTNLDVLVGCLVQVGLQVVEGVLHTVQHSKNQAIG